MKGRTWAALAAAALSMGLISCVTSPKPVERQLFAMDTFMTLTVYGEEAEDALDIMQEQIYGLEAQFSVTREGSDVHKMNHSGGEICAVSPETADLLKQTLALCHETGGSLDVTSYSAVQAWGFTTGEYKVPTQTELEQLQQRIDYQKLEQRGETVFLPEGMQLDFGAVAKGYTGDVLVRTLKERNISSACLSLGGNVQTVGSKPDGTPWRVGIQDPEGGCLAIVEVIDQAVVTSGSYQRYFQQDGERYWHIIDPETAAPADSGLVSVSVIGANGLRCDGLSTALFVMGTEEATDYWREHGDFEAVFVEQDGDIFITAGLQDCFSLGEGYQNREVSVLG